MDRDSTSSHRRPNPRENGIIVVKTKQLQQYNLPIKRSRSIFSSSRMPLQKRVGRDFCHLDYHDGYARKCYRNMCMGIKTCFTCENNPHRGKEVSWKYHSLEEKKLRRIEDRIIRLKYYINKYIEETNFRRDCDYLFNFCQNCPSKCESPLTFKRLFDAKGLL